jgi:hypothetical protein
MSQELPTGKRFFKTSPNQEKLLAYLFEGEQIRNITEAFAEVNIPDSSSLSFFKYLTHIGDTGDKYPIITMHYTVLSAITGDNMCCYTSPLKANIGGEARMGTLAIPFSDSLRVQWCDKRKGLILHDIPYEGPLVSGKIGSANTYLREYVSKMYDVIKTAALVGAPIEYDHAQSWLDPAEVTQSLSDIFEGKEVNLNSIPLLHSIGAVERTWQSSGINSRPRVLVSPTDKIKISPAIRARALYNAGRYTLPDNYEEWFDG